eukprot:9420766-Prorocentrum_lima.AAC.1
MGGGVAYTDQEDEGGDPGTPFSHKGLHHQGKAGEGEPVLMAPKAKSRAGPLDKKSPPRGGT